MIVGLVLATFLFVAVYPSLLSNIERSSDQLYLQTWGRPTVAPIIERGNLFGLGRSGDPAREVGIKYESAPTIHVVMYQQDSVRPSTDVWRSREGEFWVEGDVDRGYSGSSPPMPSGVGAFQSCATVVLILLFLACWLAGYERGYQLDRLRERQEEARKQAEMVAMLRRRNSGVVGDESVQDLPGVGQSTPLR